MMDRGEFHRLALILKDIRDAITSTGKATVDAIGENTKATGQATEQEPPKPPGTLTVAVHIPPEETNRYYVEHGKSYGLQRGAFWVNVLTFIAVAVYACITYRQWRTMDDTFREVKKQTHAAEIAADAAKSAADTAAATLKSSDKSFELTIRPYLTSNEIRFYRPWKAGEKLQLECKLRNDGKTPATRIRGLAALVWHDSKQPVRLSPPTTKLSPGVDIGSAGTSLFYTSEFPIPTELIEGTKSKNLTMIFYGDISFDSVVFTAKSPYDTLRICWFYDPDTDGFSGCSIPSYNSTTDFPLPH